MINGTVSETIEADTMIRIKRVYDPLEPDDGPRFLVDRLWPRGMKKENLPMDGWLKDVAPSDALRRWFGHDPAKWEEFCCRYDAELEPLISASPALMNELSGISSIMYFSLQCLALIKYFDLLMNLSYSQYFLSALLFLVDLFY